MTECFKIEKTKHHFEVKALNPTILSLHFHLTLLPFLIFDILLSFIPVLLLDLLNFFIIITSLYQTLLLHS